eukprot:CAMPEP_0116881968 /NCGR_PEP_ID=MMETSP0463-20121206/14056_1 /TAXON_ID=181622 /ORGANISM="Strombidinopsis sp, Strain SopsisLIS2011" /LENGTH=110 /DNA_ID=CAMNT_0004534395 /DNA_START=284 /DNA_END=616 /DNA_ORIENTATION=-
MYSMLTTDISYEDHSELHPVAQELAYYAMQHFAESKGEHALNFGEAELLMRFGGSFEINDKEYWRFVQEQLTKIFNHTDVRIETNSVYATVTTLKQYDLLSGKLLKAAYK